MSAINSPGGQKVKPWLEDLARLGYAVRGLVYGLMGILALEAVTGKGSANINQNTVFQTVVQQPFGKLLLWIIVIGLIGYGLWRLMQSVIQVEGRVKTLQRIGWFIDGIVYLVLAYIAYQIVQGRSSSGTQTQDITAKVLSLPSGPAIIMIVGIILFFVGLYNVYVGFTNRIEKRFNLNNMPAERRRLIIQLGRFGYVARGVVYAIVGYFLFDAGLTYNPSKAGGLGQALVALQSQPYGPLLLAIVAIGLIAFGIYALALARYRRISL